MLRVVMSIQTGRIKASTILRKLCGQSRKNKDLSSVFRVRTGYKNHVFTQLYWRY